MIPVFGSKASTTLEQQSAFQQAMLRLFEQRTRYDAPAREFLRAFKERQPEPVKPIHRQPLADVIRRS